jgi:DNA repair protein RAD57
MGPKQLYDWSVADLYNVIAIFRCSSLTLMDLLSVLPGFSTNGFVHIIPPLERRKVTTVDLITLDPLEIAKRARVPPADVRRLANCIVEALHADIGFERPKANAEDSNEAPSSTIGPDAALSLGSATKRAPLQWNTISTLDPAIDALLGGGIPTGYVTEVTGERYAVRPWINNIIRGPT